MSHAADKVKENINGTIVTPKGFKAVGLYSGVKRKRLDLGAIVCEVPASVASVYTTNRIQAAPLQVTKESIAKEGKIQAIVVNSGNANACTGTKGLEDAYAMRATSAKHFAIPEHYVAIASTGVIGEFLNLEKITEGIEQLVPVPTDEGAKLFNEAILTTDTVDKKACYETEINGKTVTVGGVAKGSGMINPQMATMLSFVTTDAAIASNDLQKALKQITNETFNQITVDGDTSTNDNVVVLASGLAENEQLTEDHPEWERFYLALKNVCESLAKQISRDGEGATKLVEVHVTGAKTNEDANKIAKKVVGSSLVKTAIHGADANWGRIICAIGYSGCEIDPNAVDIQIGPIKTLQASQPLPFSENDAMSYLKEEETIQIFIDLHYGDGEGKAWGCDLTYDYVRINASYRT